VFLDAGGAMNDTLIARDTANDLNYLTSGTAQHRFYVAGSEKLTIGSSGVSLPSITLTGVGD
jgi:hypothetical protein